MMESLKVILNGKYKMQRSEFLSFAEPCKSIDESQDIVKKYKKKYHDAKHICWALSIDNGETTCYSDNGEPSGTAGIQIFKEICAANLTNLIVVVIRYFGGVKLGKKGLSEAYKTSVNICLSSK